MLIPTPDILFPAGWRFLLLPSGIVILSGIWLMLLSWWDILPVVWELAKAESSGFWSYIYRHLKKEAAK